MSQITSFSEVRKVLSAYIRSAQEPGGYKLDRIMQLMAYLGNPEKKLKIIHVAGTSGKTSTCYYIAALLRAAGHKVGHTVSPHVDEVNERAQINLVPLLETEYCQELSLFLKQVKASGVHPSYFELLVAFAYWLFAKHEVSYAVVEVGLGGLLDATNVAANPDKVCVITDIGLDHTDILGKTIPEIAYQKAGIIHERNTVFMHRQGAEVMEVIERQCERTHAVLHTVTDASAIDLTHLPLFQKRNWTLAEATVVYVLRRDGYDVLTTPQRTATLHTYIPARMERIQWKDKIVVLDGSHNAQKVGALVESMIVAFPDKRATSLVSMAATKSDSVHEAFQLLATLGDSIILTEFLVAQDESRQPMRVATLEIEAQAAGFKHILLCPDPAEATKHLLESSTELLLVTGSFYLLNHVRPLLKT